MFDRLLLKWYTLGIYQWRCDRRFQFACASNNYIALCSVRAENELVVKIFFWLDHFEQREKTLKSLMSRPLCFSQPHDIRKLAHFSFGSQFNWISDRISLWYTIPQSVAGSDLTISVLDLQMCLKNHSYAPNDWRFCFISQVNQIETMDAKCVSASFVAFKTAGQVIPFPLHIFQL